MAVSNLESDLDYILGRTGGLWDDLRKARIFVTGGTGFFGRWLLSSFVAANERFGLGASVVVLTRDPEGFVQAAPELATAGSIRFQAGDVRSFSFPHGVFTHVIHAATPASAQLNTERPLEMLDITVAGTRRVLDFSRQAGVRQFLLCSSGAVYGPQPPSLACIPEDHPSGPDILNPRSAYAEGKRVSELFCATYASQFGLDVKIARGFAFIGPHLPLNVHFAVGNFLRDALAGETIRIQGDGTAFRSYLYAADLAIWLWTILLRGTSGRAYNVGSENAVSIADLASLVQRVVAPHVSIEIAGTPVPGRLAERYVPSTERARAELGLTESIDLEESIRRTASWHQSQRHGA